jgi:hypothetical protein
MFTPGYNEFLGPNDPDLLTGTFVSGLFFGRSFCVASTLSERANTSYKKIVVYSNTGDIKKEFYVNFRAEDKVSTKDEW